MEQIHLQPGPDHWLQNSIFEPYKDHYIAYLRRGRYPYHTSRVYLCCIAHFSRWVSHKHLALKDINQAVRLRFITEHLPICDCPDPVRRQPHEHRAAITHLLTVLRAKGAISRAEDRDEVSRELAAFNAYMDDVAGLAKNTRRQRLRIVKKFLLQQFKNKKRVIKLIKTTTLRSFILGEQKGWSAGTIGVVGGAIKSYLKYRAISGDQVSHLINAIPRPAQWRLKGLPDVLSNAQIDELFLSFDQVFPSRRRALAMVRLLADLGLRCDEVTKLHLDDIDWHRGTLRIKGSKGHRADILPLLPATGTAIAEYLQHERPETSNRFVFVRHEAPYHIPLQAGAVRRAVRAAYLRCGWDRTAIHVLRHSLASRLLREGTSMKYISDILRHHSLDTSMIYTKIDLNRLAAVAMPWPGSSS